MKAQTVSGFELIKALRWRYATKVFDPSCKIPAETWSAIEETLVLSPSSYGLQPWRFFVIDDRATREKLLAASWNQRQIVDASHLVVFASKLEVTQADIERFIQSIAQVRGISPEHLASYRDMMLGDLVQGPRSAMASQWAALQCYIALGTLMTAAALLGVDTCPMEGFEPGRYDEILGLRAKGFRAAVACTLGYRSLEDKCASLPKVRYDKREIIIHV